MSNQRMISDARRRAKRLARETGRPHQTHLEEIARASGRADWNAFLADPTDPVPVPEEDAPFGSNEAAREGDATTGKADVTSTLTWFGWKTTLAGCVTLAILPLVMRWNTHFLIKAAGSYERVGKVLGMVASTAGMMTMFPVLVVIVVAFVLTLTRFAPPRSDDVAHPPLGRVWRIVAARALVPALAVPFFPFALPLAMFHVPVAQQAAYNDDMRKAHQIFLHDRRTPMWLVSDRPITERTREITMVAFDQRNQPPSLRVETGIARTSPAFRAAMRKDGVLRMRGILECRDGIMALTRVETAASHDGPATAVFVSPRWRRPIADRFHLIRGDWANPATRDGTTRLTRPSIMDLCGAAPITP